MQESGQHASNPTARRRRRCVRPSDVRVNTSKEMSLFSGSLVHHDRFTEHPEGRAVYHGTEGGTVTVYPRPDEELSDVFHDLIYRQGVESIYIIAHLITGLLPTVPVSPDASCSARFELADVAGSCGLLPHRSVEAKFKAVRKVAAAIDAGARYVVVTTRDYKLNGARHKRTVSSVLFNVNDIEEYAPTEIPAQLELGGKIPPAAVSLTISPSFRELLASSHLMQYVSGVKPLAEIPSGQTWGLIAKTVGLRMLELSRIKASSGATAEDMQAVMQGREPSALPTQTRRQWITTYGGPNPDDVAVKNRNRYQDAYRAAIAELVSRGVLAKTAEANPADGRRGGWDAWLNEPVRLVPGGIFWDQFSGIAQRRGFVAGGRIATDLLRGTNRPTVAKATRSRKASGETPPAAEQLLM